VKKLRQTSDYNILGKVDSRSNFYKAMRRKCFFDFAFDGWNGDFGGAR